ncbi:epoxide hydrolase family protein [Paenibacillus alvei]|uniref:Epoxide hydrolase n=1 Tax=Paenibacillus alvei TaxID=44250 RepID=A0AAP6ZZH1_PAEAL|nr:epoxide hydrolase [Paenibacillus alvei]MCY9580283.1 epoxide hydrolase 1 [Paenibacillus alvei]MCY9583391.1 epoxide hydrolase 1 [Paenibacillus alvei]NEZ44956.1 alpha/beta fold hydrolase [Paenibacillus alvei]NOJ71007.1 epoxide hydrolase [Paenibacillus alvei]
MSLVQYKMNIHVSDEQIADLKRRLKDTRFISNPGNEDRYYGIDVKYMSELVDYWASQFDWRKAEAQINAFDHYKVEIDGVPIHFMHKPGKGPNPIPLIISHGWPWTFWHWSKVIGPLADPAAYGGDPEDAFDVYIPSLPGFGFSTPLTKPDMNFWKIADLFHKLMTEVLGHKKYAASGSDYGALITGQLGHKYADSLYGIHLGHAILLNLFQDERPWDLTDGFKVPAGTPDDIREGILHFQRTYVSHVAVHMLDSATISYGLNDSPVGLLAWIMTRWLKWGDDTGYNIEAKYTKDELLTMASIFWFSNSIEMTIRMYTNVNRYPWTPSHDRTPIVEAPMGITFLGGENIPGTTTETRVQAFLDSPDAKWYNPIYLKAHERGGHFTGWENPDAIIEDIRGTFKKLR